MLSIENVIEDFSEDSEVTFVVEKKECLLWEKKVSCYHKSMVEIDLINYNLLLLSGMKSTRPSLQNLNKE